MPFFVRTTVFNCIKLTKSNKFHTLRCRRNYRSIFLIYNGFFMNSSDWPRSMYSEDTIVLLLGLLFPVHHSIHQKNQNTFAPILELVIWIYRSCLLAKTKKWLRTIHHELAQEQVSHAGKVIRMSGTNLDIDPTDKLLFYSGFFIPKSENQVTNFWTHLKMD